MKNSIKYAVMAAVLAASAHILAADVKENWDKHCAKCHGADGKGQTRMGRQSGARDYTDAKVQESFDDAKGIAAIKSGVKDGAKEKMKAYGDVLSEDEMKALLAHVRAFKK